MMDLSDIPPSDVVDGACHPSQTTPLIGQSKAEDQFLEAFNSGRLHHGWLITGPKGIGKATLAWQIAQFLRATPDKDANGGGLFGDAPVAHTSLEIAPDHPVRSLIAAQAEPGIFSLRRGYDEKTKKLRSVISVDDVRGLKKFFGLSTIDGGRKIVIVDAADDLNVSSANAILKLLEEPPKDTFLLLICHQPSRLLPTIRSRCRELRCVGLGPNDMQQALTQAGFTVDDTEADPLAALAGGSVGTAIQLLQMNGIATYQSLVNFVRDIDRLDVTQAAQFADKYAGKSASQEFALLIFLVEHMFNRLARTCATGQPITPKAAEHEFEAFSKLNTSSRAAQNWANLAQVTSQRLQHGRAVNLDPSSLILDTLFKMETTATQRS